MTFYHKKTRAERAIKECNMLGKGICWSAKSVMALCVRTTYRQARKLQTRHRLHRYLDLHRVRVICKFTFWGRFTRAAWVSLILIIRRGLSECNRRAGVLVRTMFNVEVRPHAVFVGKITIWVHFRPRAVIWINHCPVFGRILGVRRHEDSLFDISKQNAVEPKPETEIW